MSTKFTEDEARAFEWLMAGFSPSPRAIRALKERALTAEERLEQMTRERDEARAEVAALLARIDELECECGEAWKGVLDAALIHAELVRARDEARAQLAQHFDLKEKP